MRPAGSPTMTLDNDLVLANSAFLLFLLVVLLGRRVFQTLPVFVAYQGYSFAAGVLLLTIVPRFPAYTIEFWIGFTVLDSLLSLGVLAEVARHILRFNQRDSPSGPLFALLFALSSSLLWMLTHWTAVPARDIAWRIGMHVMQWVAMLGVSALLALAWWSHMLTLRWPERELRIVIGMGFWGLVQVCVVILHAHGLNGANYHWLDQLTPLSVLGVLIYWLYYFWHEPASAGEARLNNARS